MSRNNCGTWGGGGGGGSFQFLLFKKIFIIIISLHWVFVSCDIQGFPLGLSSCGTMALTAPRHMGS